MESGIGFIERGEDMALRKVKADDLSHLKAKHSQTIPEFYCVVCKQMRREPCKASNEIGGWCCLHHQVESPDANHIKKKGPNNV